MSYLTSAVARNAWNSRFRTLGPRGEIDLPVVSSHFSAVENPGVPKVTGLQTPHRVADAILRNSYLGNSKFRSQRSAWNSTD